MGHVRKGEFDAVEAAEEEDEEEEEEDEEGEEESPTPTPYPMTSSLAPSAKGRVERLQWSQTNAISSPSRTHSLYFEIEMEREHFMCVHLKHMSHSTALLAFVTPLAQTTHG